MTNRDKKNRSVEFFFFYVSLGRGAESRCRKVQELEQSAWVYIEQQKKNISKDQTSVTQFHSMKNFSTTFLPAFLNLFLQGFSFCYFSIFTWAFGIPVFQFRLSDIANCNNRESHICLPLSYFCEDQFLTLRRKNCQF